MNKSRHHTFATSLIRGVAALLLIVAGLATVHAESVFKCRDARGQIAYQDHACANPAQETRIEIAPPPAPVAPPQYAVHGKSQSSHRQVATRSASGHRDRAGAMSYECRAADGEVFYRHSGCPKSITAAAGNSRLGSGKRKTARGSSTRSVSVSARPLTRSDACKRMASAGSIGRAGHQHDDAVSTYDRNAGRDPCRNS